MGKKYSYKGYFTVFVEGMFEDDGKSDLEDQALESMRDSINVSPDYDEEYYEDNWTIERGSVQEIIGC